MPREWQVPSTSLTVPTSSLAKDRFHTRCCLAMAYTVPAIMSASCLTANHITDILIIIIINNNKCGTCKFVRFTTPSPAVVHLCFLSSGDRVLHS
jgi:hypothetical protein